MHASKAPLNKVVCEQTTLILSVQKSSRRCKLSITWPKSACFHFQNMTKSKGSVRMEDYRRNGIKFVRRDRLEIVSAVISVAQEPSSLTHIMYQVNLSHKQMKEYLRFMTGCGLIEECKNGRAVNRKLLSYRATEKGNRFLNLYCESLILLHGEHLFNGNGGRANAYLRRYCMKNKLAFGLRSLKPLGSKPERVRDVTL